MNTAFLPNQTATFFMVGLMSIPPTWNHGLEPSSLQRHFEDFPATFPTQERKNNYATKDFGVPNPGFITIQTPENARRASLNAVVSRINEFKYNPLPDTDEEDRQNMVAAADVMITLLSAYPNYLPIPKPMLLSSQVAVFWETENVFAELDVGADGSIAVFAKKVGRPDLLEDTSMSELHIAGIEFPNNLDRFLMPF